MKKHYLFFITTSGDRTNIMSDFKVIEKEEMLKYLETKSKWGNMVRYAYIGGQAQRLQLMKLDEFDDVFEGQTMSNKQLSEFREEIRMKYGEQPVKKTEVRRGDILREGLSSESVYLDLVELTENIPERKNSYVSYRNTPAQTKITKGYGWLGHYGVTVTKSFPKRFSTGKTIYDENYKHPSIEKIQDGMSLDKYGTLQTIKFL